MPRRRPTEPVTVTTVHPDVWSDALRQAGGDASRIEVISETSVVVHNRSDWRQHRRGPAPLRRVAPPNPPVTPVAPVTSVAAVAPIAAVAETSDAADEPTTEAPSPAPSQPTSTSPVPQPTFLHSAPPTDEDADESTQPKAAVIPIAAFVAPQLKAADSES